MIIHNRLLSLAFAASALAASGCQSVPSTTDPNRPIVCTISGVSDDAVKASVTTPFDTGVATLFSSRPMAPVTLQKLCTTLTATGIGKPTVTWPIELALTRAADGTVTIVALTQAPAPHAAPGTIDAIVDADVHGASLRVHPSIPGPMLWSLTGWRQQVR